jgi:MFS family permease
MSRGRASSGAVSALHSLFVCLQGATCTPPYRHVALYLCSSAFFYGYTVSNVAAGSLAMRTSVKAVLGSGVWVWSAFTVLTPAAARSSRWALLLARFLVGLGEGRHAVPFPS